MTTCPPLPLSLSASFFNKYLRARAQHVSLTERIERRKSQLAHVPNRDKVSLGARNARRSVSRRQKWHFSSEKERGRNKTEKLFQGQGKESTRKEEKRRRRRGLFTYETRAAAVCRTLRGEG